MNLEATSPLPGEVPPGEPSPDPAEPPNPGDPGPPVPNPNNPQGASIPTEEFPPRPA